MVKKNTYNILSKKILYSFNFCYVSVCKISVLVFYSCLKCMKNHLTSFFLLSTLSLLVKADDSIQFTGSIIIQSIDMHPICIRNVTERKILQICAGKNELASTVKTSVYDVLSPGGNANRREITLIYN